MVFAGDTRQQQLVEAGPGLRLIRDVAGSIRVDRIRRQKADLEDVLVHVHKETPEQARFRAGLTNAQERNAILADYEAMERKPVFAPWQVVVSNERLLREGRAILDDPATYRAHLDRIEDGRERLRDAVSRMERFSSAYRTQSRSRDRGPTRSL